MLFLSSILTTYECASKSMAAQVSREALGDRRIYWQAVELAQLEFSNNLEAVESSAP